MRSHKEIEDKIKEVDHAYYYSKKLTTEEWTISIALLNWVKIEKGDKYGKKNRKL